ncbi:MAG: transglutaminase domain-containing protein, partial [Promethearchaeota archaeon]
MSESGSGKHIGKGTIILLLLLTSFSIMAAMPASFYFNLGEMGENLLNSDMLEQFMEYIDRFPLFNFTGNMSDFFDFFDFPTDEPFEPDVEMPDEWDIPDFDWDDLPEDWGGEIPPFIPEDIPEGFEIPEGYFPEGMFPEGLDPSMYAALAFLGLGLFGNEAIKAWVNSTPENRYWRLTTYDTFNNSNWIQSNDTVYNFDYTDKSPVPSDEKYLVWMNITYLRNGSGSLPIPHLWPTGEIMENLSVISPATIDWELLTDPSDSIIWNATISDAPSDFTISLVYNATYDETVTPSSIKSNMISQIVDGTPFDPPGTSKYRQIPTLDPIVVADIEKVKNSVFSQSLDLYNTCLAVLEYFKTRYTWVSYVDRTSQFNATALVDLGYGTSADFASNFALYLRAMNISTRVVWGGVGYTKDSDSPTSNDMYRLSPRFYTEVWIPNATNTGGNWLQLDPSPVPKEMFGMTGSMSFDPINPRIPDDRMETYHYILSLLSNISDYHFPANHLNRDSDFYKLNATLYRDAIPISQTMLGETINFTFADITDNIILGYNDSIDATWADSFDSNSLVGPHRLNASFYSLTNNTIIVLNGSTAISVNPYNPDPIIAKRGIDNNFLFYAKLYDPVTGRSLSDNYLGANISQWDLIQNNPCITNQSGIATMNLSVNSSVPIGYNNMSAKFNGTFIISSEYAFLPYDDMVYVSAAPSISPNHLIQVNLDINISLFKNTEFINDVIIRNNNVTLLGQVTFDNGTTINNAPVDIHWQNTSGQYDFGTFYTNSSGWYNYTLYISHLHDSSVSVWANTTLSYGTETVSDLYTINCQNTTSIHLYDPSVGDYVVRDFDSIPIHGYLSDPYDAADLSNQEIYLIDKNTGMNISDDGDFITDANGNFTGTLNIPLEIPVGNYDILASFNGTWNADGTPIAIPSSSSNSTDHTILVVGRSLLVKNLTTNQLSRNVEPESIINIGEDLDVYGYLKIDNGTVLIGEEVNAWETLPNGTTIKLGNALTDGSGFYNITYSVPSDHPTGNTEIFVNYSAGDIYTSYLTNATATEDPEFGYLCDLIINYVS